MIAKKHGFFFFFAFLLLLPLSFGADEKSGTDAVKHYASDNGLYALEVDFGGEGQCTFKKAGQVIWQQDLLKIPGLVNISNDGKSIVMADLDWGEDGSYTDVAFFGEDGHMVKELLFKEPRWIRKAAFSNDGLYYVTSDCPGNDYMVHESSLTLYSVPDTKVLWRKGIGNGRTDNIFIANESRYILTTTYDNQPDLNNARMRFTYLDREGNILWEDDLSGVYPNFSPDPESIRLSPDGLQFTLYDASSKSWHTFRNINSKVVEV
jgi:hypothetical protein